MKISISNIQFPISNIQKTFRFRYSLFIIGYSLFICAPARADTFLDVTGPELNRRINVIPQLEESVDNLTTWLGNSEFSGGLADIGFLNALISTNFSSLNFTNEASLIDLSPYIGVDKAVVFIKASAAANGNHSIFLKPADEPLNIADYYGGAGVSAAPSSGGNTVLYLIVPTDSLGRILARVSGLTWRIELIAFIRRHPEAQ